MAEFYVTEQSFHVVVLHPASTRPGNPRFQRELDELNDSAIAAIDSMGWTSELVPSSERLTAHLCEAVDRADLLVIMGGEDVSPELYGGELNYPSQGDHQPVADRAEIMAIMRAVDQSIPVFGVCRGAQLINVAFGGTLIQHLSTSSIHRGEVPGRGPYVRHPVRLTPEGREKYALSGAVRDGEIVQSTHHQAVGKVAEGFLVTAVAPDGVIEAIMHESLPIHAVQWHPEHPDSIGLPFPRLLRAMLQ